MEVGLIIKICLISEGQVLENAYVCTTCMYSQSSQTGFSFQNISLSLCVFFFFKTFGHTVEKMTGHNSKA